MTTLLLIRHGENDVMRTRLAGRLPEVHLNERGRRQARALAAALAGAPLQAVFSSPLERAVETAEPLARVHGLAVEIRPRFIEVDYGRWQGLTYKQLRRYKEWKVVQETPSLSRFPGGESLREVQERVVAELAELSGEREMIAVVAHGDIVRLALAHYLNLALDDFQRLAIAPASVSVVHLSDKRPLVLHMNQVQGLEWPEKRPGKPPEKGKKGRAGS